MKTELNYNDAGYAFVPDEELTKWVQHDGCTLKGLSDYIVLQVHHKENGHVTNLLFDTKTQTPVDELGLGLEQCACKIDLIKIKLQCGETDE